MTSSKGITPLQTWARKNVRIHNEYFIASIGEFIGTLILCLFAVAASCQYVLMPGETFMMPVFGGVFGLMIAVTALGGLSGALINPVVTFALALSGHLSWNKVPFHWFFQFLGGYIGAGIAFALYKVPLQDFFQVEDVTTLPHVSGIFSHFPTPQSDGFIGLGLADQTVCTCVLVIAIFSAIDPRNMGIPKWFIGPFFAIVVAGIGFTFKHNAGAVMNPARDLGPRLMAVSLGWKAKDVFMYNSTDFDPTTSSGDGLRHYWIIPLFGPFIGAFIGTLIYIFLIGSHLPDTKEEKELQEKNNNKYEDDWRSTRFIPKASVPPEAQINNHPPSLAPSYTTAADLPNYTTYRNGTLANGVHNPAFVKDNGRLRQ